MTTRKRDDGTEIEVEYVVEQHGQPGNGWDDAGEPTIVCITEAFDAAGNDVALADDERQRLELEIGQELDSEPYDDWPDE